MKSTFKISALFILGLITLTSCKKDKEDPTITITSPENHSEHHEGSSVNLKATFADDRDLASYEVMVGDVDGNHIHEFHFEDENEISGESYDYSSTLTFPDSLSLDAYYVHFMVTDAEGKTASDKLMLHVHQ